MKSDHHIVGLIYAAATDTCRWNEMLENLGEELRASTVFWVEYNFKKQQGQILHAVGCDQQYIRRFQIGFIGLNPWFQSDEPYTPGTVTYGEDIINNQQIMETMFYREWLEPQNLLHRICGTVKRVGHQVYLVVALRDKVHTRFVARHRNLLRRLIPHLNRALEINHHLWRLAIEEDVLNCMPFAIAVVDKRGRLLLMNGPAERLLHYGDDIYTNFASLTALQEGIAPRLKALIEGAAATTAGTGTDKGGALLISRRPNQPQFWVSVLPLACHLRKVICEEHEVAQLFITAPEHLSEIPAVVLTMYYGLTAAERRLTLLILQGYRQDEAAAKLNITFNTVRTHMKQIYAKTQVSRQTDLVRLLLTGPGSPLNPLT